MAWRRAGRLSLTIVAKATFQLVADGFATFAKPVEILQQPKPIASSRAIFADTDLVPYKPRADVIYVGNAWAPRPVQALHVRIGVYRGQPLLEKSLQCVGERFNDTAQPAPFYRLPVTWDRAWVGANNENPIGVARGSGRMANLFDTRDRDRAVGLGAITTSFPERKRLLGATDPRSLDIVAPPANAGGVWAVEVADALSFDYFSSAPRDQRIELLQGDESIVLENLVEGLSRVHTRLQNC